MLYDRLYKKMKKHVYFNSPVTRSLDYVTFVVLIPISLGALLSNWLFNSLWRNDEIAILLLFLPMGIAALYIHLCTKHDKNKS